ncbi:MAG TPA: nucleoside monophosphate kinase [Acidimicrobiales bacterium]
MRVVLIGAPGSGKGTQGPLVAWKLGVPYLSAGDLLRDEVARGTDLGRAVAVCLDRGELVPDELMADTIVDRLTALTGGGRDDREGYVLDGFPRTVAQAELAERRLPGGLADHVVFLTLPDDVARDRLAHRRQGRSDDDAATIEHRLRVFHEETEPLLDHYRTRGTLHVVDGDRPQDDVLAAIVAALGA